MHPAGAALYTPSRRAGPALAARVSRENLARARVAPTDVSHATDHLSLYAAGGWTAHSVVIINIVVMVRRELEATGGSESE